MTELAKNITHIGTSNQDFQTNEPGKPYERMKNEPALWYMRFQVYLNIGPARSLRKALVSEPNQKATKGDTIQKKEGVTLSDLSVPGAWQRASKVWNWKERAAAFDLEKQERAANEMRGIASGYYYASRSARIMELSDLAATLKNNLKNVPDYETLMKITVRIQSIFTDIEALMVAMGEPFGQVADSAAHGQYAKKLAEAILATATSPQELELLKKRLTDYS